MGDERRTLNAQSCIALLRPSRVSRVSRVSLRWRFSSSTAGFTHSRDGSLASQENLEESLRAPDLMRIAPDPQGTERLHPLVRVMTDATRGNRENPVSQNTNSGASSVFFTGAPRHGTLPDVVLSFEFVRVRSSLQNLAARMLGSCRGIKRDCNLSQSLQKCQGIDTRESTFARTTRRIYARECFHWRRQLAGTIALFASTADRFRDTVRIQKIFPACGMRLARSTGQRCVPEVIATPRRSVSHRPRFRAQDRTRVGVSPRPPRTSPPVRLVRLVRLHDPAVR